MKILHTVEFYEPSVGGAQEVVKQLSEHLVALGHDVTVATTILPNRVKKIINGVKIKEFAISGNQVRGMTGEIEEYKKFLLNQKFDVIMNYAAQQWATDIFFDVIDKIKAKKILVPCGFSGLYDSSYSGYFKNLPNVLKKYDASVYLSHHYRDIDFSNKHKIKNTYVIPNGADEKEFGKLSSKNALEFRKKIGLDPQELLILNVSNHTGIKGHKEAIRAFQQSKIKDATLLMVGDVNHHAGCYRRCLLSSKIQNSFLKYVKSDKKTLKVLHLSRKDTRIAYMASDFFLFLSNLECSPLVLFESAAAGKPFISSNCGNAKEIAQWTKAGLIINSQQKKNGYTEIDISDASQKIEMLVKNSNLRLTMGKAGRDAWRRHFSWKRISEEYENLYKKLIKK